MFQTKHLGIHLTFISNKTVSPAPSVSYQIYTTSVTSLFLLFIKLPSLLFLLLIAT